MTTNRNGWLQTISILLAVALAAGSTVAAISRQNHALVGKMMKFEAELSALQARVADGGWSYRQHLEWVAELRMKADHEIPSPSNFPPVKN